MAKTLTTDYHLLSVLSDLAGRRGGVLSDRIDELGYRARCSWARVPRPRRNARPKVSPPARRFLAVELFRQNLQLLVTRLIGSMESITVT